MYLPYKFSLQTHVGNWVGLIDNSCHMLLATTHLLELIFTPSVFLSSFFREAGLSVSLIFEQLRPETRQ